jgi:hypothetical protein
VADRRAAAASWWAAAAWRTAWPATNSWAASRPPAGKDQATAGIQLGPGRDGQPPCPVPARLGLLQPRGQFGHDPGGLAEGVGGPVEAGLEPGRVDQEGLAGRPPPGPGHDHEQGGSAQPVADLAKGAGGRGHAPRPAATAPGSPAGGLTPTSPSPSATPSMVDGGAAMEL